MSDDTRRILELVAQSKITVDEAQQLLAAITTPAAVADTAPAAADPADPNRPRPRWMRIAIHKTGREGRRDKDVNIRVPVAVVRGGMRLGSIIATFAGEKAAQRMKDRGVELDMPAINGDLSKMNGPEFDASLKTLDEMNIEINDGKSQVRITAE